MGFRRRFDDFEFILVLFILLVIVLEPRHHRHGR
jgi:hypothetical protein